MNDLENKENHMDTQQNACAQCGAMLQFAPGTAALRCPYCGAETQIAKPDAPIDELDYRSFLERIGQEKSTQEVNKVKCDKCGAETTVSSDTVADICPFCGAPMVFSGSMSRAIKPEGLLPFKISNKEAFARYQSWIRKLWFAPGDLNQYARTENRLAGIYLPYWTYDSNTLTPYQGERGDYYYTTQTYTARENGRLVTRTQQVRHTRWTPASGTVENHFNDLLVLAGKSLPSKYVDLLEPWDLPELVPYADEFLSGFRAETYQVSLPEGFEFARKMMAPIIEATIRSNIGGDEQRIHSAATQYSNITFKHILLPVWMSAYRFREIIYRIVINARTGDVQGERPYSAWKIAGAVLAGLLIVGILILVSSSR
jgi:predicted RNA-binding Zn-ribbon protein involved in translation (DUF1610 family)